MKVLKVLIIIVVLLLAVFFIGGMLLPKTYSVSRSTIIKAPESEVYTNISDFHNFLKWNPWSRMEPEATVTITGTPAQPGHLYKWSGKKTGKGQMEIMQIQDPLLVDILLTFTEPMKSVAKTAFNMEKVSGGTKVTWSMKGESDAALDRWMYLNMDNMIGKDFESGLKNLKEMSEK